METMKAPNEMSRNVETRTTYHNPHTDLRSVAPKILQRERGEKKLSVGIIGSTYAVYYATRSFCQINTCLVFYVDGVVDSRRTKDIFPFTSLIVLPTVHGGRRA